MDLEIYKNLGIDSSQRKIAEMLAENDRYKQFTGLSDIQQQYELASKYKQENNVTHLSSMQQTLNALGMQKSVASKMTEIRQMMEFNNEKFGLDSIKKSVLDTLDANKASYLDGIKSAQEALVNKDNLFHSQTMRALREISELSSFKAISSLENLPFENLAKNFIFDERLFTAFDTGSLGADLFEVMDEETTKELAKTNDFNLLSDSTKQAIYRILEAIILCYLVNVATGSNPNVIENLSKLFATDEQVEFIGTPSEKSTPDNRHNEQENIETIYAAELGKNESNQVQPKDSRADKLAQLQASQHDPLFMADLQEINDDFAHIDSEAW